MDDEPIEDVQSAVAELDWFLRAIVVMANDRFQELPVTLHVGGVVITGYVMSGADYFQQIGERLVRDSTDASEEARQAYASIFTVHKDIYPNLPAHERADAGEDLIPETFQNYIHLRDARFFVGSILAPTNEPVLWRGRLSAVDGWALGVMSVDS